MMGNRKDHIRVRKQRQRKTKSDIPPLPKGASRAVWHRKGRGGGRSGGLKDLETGQVASRAVPVPGPKADPGTQAAKADPGTQAAKADPGTPAATADPGTLAATADPGTLAAMADPGTQVAMEGSPPKNFLGKAPHLRGALRSRGRRAGQGQRRERWAGRDQRR